jgi:hypothetical protein
MERTAFKKPGVSVAGVLKARARVQKEKSILRKAAAVTPKKAGAVAFMQLPGDEEDLDYYPAQDKKGTCSSGDPWKKVRLMSSPASKAKPSAASVVASAMEDDDGDDFDWPCGDEADEPEKAKEGEEEEDVPSKRVEEGEPEPRPLQIQPYKPSMQVEEAEEETYGPIPWYNKERRQNFCFLCEIDSLDQRNERYRNIIAKIEQLANKVGVSINDRPYWVLDLYNKTFRDKCRGKEWKIADVIAHFHLKHGNYTSSMIVDVLKAKMLAFGDFVFDNSIARFRGGKPIGANTEAGKLYLKIVQSIMTLFTNNK